MQIPSEFNKLCERFFQDIDLVALTRGEIAGFLVRGLNDQEKQSLKPFLDDIIAHCSAEELLRIWNDSPSDFDMDNGEGLRAFLMIVRAKLM